MEKDMHFSLFRSSVARRRDATALKGRAAASAPSSYFWRVLTDFRLLMVCIFIFFLASSPPSPFHSRPFSVHGAHSLARHASQAPRSTFSPYRTQRLHGPHLREEAVFPKCPLPPERALSGLSWAFAGSDRGSPPGDGMDTGNRHLPAGAAQGDPRGGPESARLSYNGLILGAILVPLFRPNLHTVLQKVSKCGPQKLSKGRGIVAPTIPQQSPPTIPPKAYLK
jgi:hypothetical protein